MKFFKHSLLLVVAFTLVGACGLTVSDEERLLRADQHIAAGNFRTASIEFKNILASDPDNVQARIGLAHVSLGLGEVLDAEKEVRRAADLGAPAASVGPLHLQVLLAKGQYTEALAALGQYESDLTDAQVTEFRGSALLGLNSYEAAEETYRQWLASRSGDAFATVGLARALASTGRREAAIVELDAFLEGNADNADAWAALGSIRFSLGEYETAADALMRSLENSVLETGFRAYVGTAVVLADSQLRAQRIDDARITIGQVAAIAPSAPATLLLSARIAEVDQDYAAAARFLQNILVQRPNDFRALMFLADIQVRQNNLGQAAELLNRVVAIAPDNIQARKMLARVQLRQSDPGTIVETLAPFLDSGDADVYSLIGQANLQTGDVAEAIENFRSASEANPGGISEQLNLSISYLAGGETKLAIEQLLALPPGQDGDYRREQLLIMAYAGSNRMDAAAAVADMLSSDRSGDPVAMNIVAGLRFGAGAHGEARSAYQQSLKLDSTNITALLGMARLEVSEENISEARIYFKRIRELNSVHPVATLGLAQLAFIDGDSNSAYRLLQEARENHPTDVRPVLAQAQLFLRDDRRDEALAAARDAAIIGSGISIVNAAIGKVLLETGAHDEALVSYQKAAKRAPNSAQIQMALGYAFLSLDRTVDAQAALGHALELDGELVPAAAALILVEVRQGRYNSALRRVREMRERLPTDVTLMLLEGEVYTTREEYANAADAYALAVENGAGQRAVMREYQSRRLGGLADVESPLIGWLGENPADVSVRRFLADHYLVTGDSSDAMREYERLLESEPDNGEVLNNLAWQYQRSGNLNRARVLAERAWELQPEYGSIADTLGWIYRDLGEVEMSADLLREAAKLSPDNGEIRFHLAVVLSETGSREEARELLRTLLSSNLQYSSKDAAARLWNELSSGN